MSVHANQVTFPLHLINFCFCKMELYHHILKYKRWGDLRHTLYLASQYEGVIRMCDTWITYKGTNNYFLFTKSKLTSLSAMSDHDFNPTWDKSNSKRFEGNGVYGNIGLRWFSLGFGCEVFSFLEKVAFLLRESTLLFTFFSALTHYVPLWMQESYSY